MATVSILKDVIGSRGESIAKLKLTEYTAFPQPLFLVGFLGDKWPSIDFYVELEAVRGKRPYFLAQCKSTSSALTRTSINVDFRRKDIDKMLRLPGPTYLIAVHVPSERVFAKAIYKGMPVKSVSTIRLSNELDGRSLQQLHAEVLSYWSTGSHKPTTSVFL